MGDLMGTLMGIPSVADDPQQAPVQGPAGPGDYLNGGFNPQLQNQFLTGNLQALSDVFSQQAAQQQDQQKPGLGINLKPNGTAVVSGDIQTIMQGLQGAQNYQKLVQGYSAQLAAREAQTRSQPLPSLLAQLAGNLAANDPKLPGWVRGVGVTAQQLNPTVQQLQGQQLGLAQTLAQLQAQNVERQIQVGQLDLGNRKLALDEAYKTEKEGRLTTKADNQIHEAQVALAQAAAKAGTITPDTRTAYSHLSDQEFQGALALSQQAQKNQATDRTARSDLQRQKDEAAAQRAQTHAEAVQQTAAMQIDAKKELADRPGKVDIADRQAVAREFQAYKGPVQKGVQAVVEIKHSVEQLKRDLEQVPEAYGMIEGRINKTQLVNLYGPEKAEQIARVGADFFTNLDAVRGLIDGGTRFWNPGEFNNLSPKLVSANKSKAVNLGILDALDAYADRTAKKIVNASPDVDWSRRSSVWGEYADKILAGTKTPALQGPAGGKRAGQAAQTAPGAISADDIKKMLGQQ